VTDNAARRDERPSNWANLIALINSKPDLTVQNRRALCNSRAEVTDVHALALSETNLAADPPGWLSPIAGV